MGPGPAPAAGRRPGLEQPGVHRPRRPRAGVLRASLAARLPAGLTLRPSGPGDDGWERHLFAATRPFLAALPLPPDQLEALADGQHRAQQTTYRGAFPDADFAIVETDGRPVGRLYLGWGPPIHVIDIAILPADQGRGTGSALLRAVCAEADAAGIPVVLSVEATNVGAQRLYDRLGFVIDRSTATDWSATRAPQGLS